MQQAKKTNGVRKMKAPFNKIVNGGVTIEWTDSKTDAESAFKEANGYTEWWSVNTDGTAKLLRSKQQAMFKRK